MKKTKGLTILLIIFSIIVGTAKITLADEVNTMTVNGVKVTDQSEIQGIEITNKMDNGTEKENIEINTIINIKEPGTYEFSGKLEDGQISINSNNISGEIRIIFNNCDITCKSAPAIFVYGKNIENDKCKVIIETADKSQNAVKGGKIKTSVEDWDNQNKVEYYVEKGTDDDGKYYERYKYDAAISSDISLIFEGKGTLNVEGLEKEGIETKGDLTFNSGTIIIKSQDDAINACTDGKSKITINDGLIVASVSVDAEEGDGIDSNGTLYINGGTVYTFACPGSDNGLDSDGGTYINGGEVVSTGSMYEEFKTSNNTKIVQMQLSKKISKDTNIAIVNKNEEVVYAFKTNREITTFAVSSDKLENDDDYTVYSNAEITGKTNDYGIYTDITNYDLSKATLEENSKSMGMSGPNRLNNTVQQETENTEKKDYTTVAIALIAISVIIAAIILILDIKSKKQLTIINLIIGIIIGIILTCGIYIILDSKQEKQPELTNQFEERQEEFMNQKEPPEKPDDQPQMNRKANTNA